MSILSRSRIVLMAVAAAAFSQQTSAFPVVVTQVFPSGFNVSVNNGPLTPSGPITIAGIVDTTTADIYADPNYGEFPLTNVTFTGAGFVSRPVSTLLSLVTFGIGCSSPAGCNFAFQRQGEFNEGITGWNGSTSSGPFMSNVNSLSTLVALPYTTTGTSTFWYDGLGSNLWTLALGGDTIGANLGGGGPDGTFSIIKVPEPSYLPLGFVALCAVATCRRNYPMRRPGA